MNQCYMIQPVLQQELNTRHSKLRYIKAPGYGVLTFVFFSGIEKRERKKNRKSSYPACTYLNFGYHYHVLTNPRAHCNFCKRAVAASTLSLAQSIAESTLLFFKFDIMPEGILSKDCFCFQPFCQTWGAIISSSHSEDTVCVRAKYAVVVEPPCTAFPKGSFQLGARAQILYTWQRVLNICPPPLPSSRISASHSHQPTPRLPAYLTCISKVIRSKRN